MKDKPKKPTRVYHVKPTDAPKIPKRPWLVTDILAFICFWLGLTILIIDSTLSQFYDLLRYLPQNYTNAMDMFTVSIASALISLTRKMR